jgi:glycosyltransferase involved in cell wall biosynthesis
MAKFDIVIPCYNYGRFLESCVRSVLSQSETDLRVLVIDDASSDDSVAAARKLTDEDSRVALVAHDINKGHIETYNEGLAWASSDYLLLLSADDLLVPGALARAGEVMDANSDVVLTFGDCVAWFEAEPPPRIKPIESYSWERCDLLRLICATATNLVPTPTAIVRTSAQKIIGGYRKSLPHSGDMEMWLRFAASGSVARIGAIQAIYRKHDAAMSNAYFESLMADWRQRELAFESFFDAYQDHIDPLGNLATISRLALADAIFQQGAGFMRRGRITEGFSLLRCAMDRDSRLRQLPALLRLLKPPGPAGRSWAVSSLAQAAKRFRGGARRLSKEGPPASACACEETNVQS